MPLEYMRENGDIGHSEIRINDIIEILEHFSLVKISFNGVVIYNDYDGEENECPKNLIPMRLWNSEKYIITSIKIEIVDFHHAIVEMFGKYCDA